MGARDQGRERPGGLKPLWQTWGVIRLRLPLALLSPFLAAALAAHAQLSDVEHRIVAAVKGRSPAALELLERSARINSGSANLEGVRATGELFRSELEGLGFATRWVDMPPEMKRAGHLVAERSGSKGKRLLLLGHLDTVFGKSSKVATWERRGDRVRGQGVSDMKGGIVVMIEALRALHEVGVLEGSTAAVMLTGDEESVGSPIQAARAEMVVLAKRSDVALSFEGMGREGARETAVVARRAQTRWDVAVKARSGHSSRVFTDELGFGAIYEGARIVNAFREKLVEPGVTFNPGIVLGGTEVRSPETGANSASGRRNVIATDFVVNGDLRFRSSEQGEQVRARMREIVAASLPGTSATIRFEDRYPAMPPSDSNKALLEAFSRASQDAGLGAIESEPPDARGAGDVQFTAPHVPGLDGLGAYGRNEHSDDEELEIASIERGAIRAALLIYRLTR